LHQHSQQTHQVHSHHTQHQHPYQHTAHPQHAAHAHAAHPQVHAQHAAHPQVHAQHAAHSQPAVNYQAQPASNFQASHFQKPVPVSAERLREIEENDRRLAEKLQAEMDKEYEQTVTQLPKPSEALQRLRELKQKKAVKATPAENTDELARDMAEQGFVVKVGKKKPQRTPK